MEGPTDDRNQIIRETVVAVSGSAIFFRHGAGTDTELDSYSYFMYFYFSGIASEVASLFDPLLSPRCFAILAKKS